MTSQELKEARRKLCLSQAQMSLFLGMSQCHYSRLESGAEDRKPTKQHSKAVKVIRFISENGLLHKLTNYFINK